MYARFYNSNPENEWSGLFLRHPVHAKRGSTFYWLVLYKSLLCVRQKQAVREAAKICPAPPLQVDLWPFDLESGVRVSCDVGNLCANFCLLGLSVLELGPRYATDGRQTKASLNASALWRRRHWLRTVRREEIYRWVH